MFTGIITDIGTIQKIDKNGSNKIFTVQASKILKNKKIGDSISIDGACHTIIHLDKDIFQFESMPETLKLTNLDQKAPQDKLNLEESLKIGDSLDGHLVQGHVDSTAKVVKIKDEGESAVVTISLPPKLIKFIAYKGSVTINGVSLTISDLRKDGFSVSLIPHTLQNTNLGTLKSSDIVNIEIDMLMRYLERLLNDKEQQASYEYLKERGFI